MPNCIRTFLIAFKYLNYIVTTALSKPNKTRLTALTSEERVFGNTLVNSI